MRYILSDESRKGVTKTKTLENQDLRPKTRLSFRDYENQDPLKSNPSKYKVKLRPK